MENLGLDDKFSLSEEDKESLDKDIENYDKYYLEQSLALDKNLIAISGASFSVSLAFIDKIINFRQADFVWSFWLSMGLLLFCIITTTVSFWISLRATRFARDMANEARQQGDRRVLAQNNRWNPWVDRTNNISIGLFVLGLLFLAFFIFENGIFSLPNGLKTKPTYLLTYAENYHVQWQKQSYDNQRWCHGSIISRLDFPRRKPCSRATGITCFFDSSI